MSETDIGVNVASTQPQDAHGIRQRLRPNYPRVRTGCLTCRRRKKKCDEKKPLCSGCSRNKLACRWPENRGDESPTTSLARSSNYMNGSPVPKVKIANHLHRLDNPCTLKPESYLLLRHYLCETGAMLAAQPLHKNPFITHVAPLAYMDDLLMHAVLALSGTHLAFGNGSDDRIQTAALCHYSTVISGLRQRVDLFQVQDIQKSVRMLLILLVMCHYEVLSGDKHGAMFSHLRACRQLIIALAPSSESLSEDETLGPDRGLFGFCLELYAFLLISNTFTSFGTILDESLPYDEFLFSLDDLSSYSTFGTMFGGNQGLFELIPQVALFSSARMTEEKSGLTSMSPKLKQLHDNLEVRIATWFTPVIEVDSSETTQEKLERLAATEVLRNGLFIYLAAASSGSIISDKVILDRIQHHIDVLGHNLKQITIPRLYCNLMWPTIIAGSCMVKESQRVSLVRGLEQVSFRMKHVSIACELLKMLWDNPAPESYGPYGLYLLEKKGFRLPIL